MKLSKALCLIIWAVAACCASVVYIAATYGPSEAAMGLRMNMVAAELNAESTGNNNALAETDPEKYSALVDQWVRLRTIQELMQPEPSIILGVLVTISLTAPIIYWMQRRGSS